LELFEGSRKNACDLRFFLMHCRDHSTAAIHGSLGFQPAVIVYCQIAAVLRASRLEPRREAGCQLLSILGGPNQDYLRHFLCSEAG
jgi:hypothetical protein